MHKLRSEDLSDLRALSLGRDKGLRKVTGSEAPNVFVVNGNDSVRRSLERTIKPGGWEVSNFASAAAFLASPRALAPGCLLLDSVLPDSCGIDLQEQLRQSEACLSTVFVIEQPDMRTAVRAMRAGAVEVLARPVEAEALLRAIHDAIRRSRAALDRHAALLALRNNYAALSKREREVMALIVSGCLNKQAAAQLGISEITVKAHRGQAMRKMGARSFADLVKMAGHLPQALEADVSAGRKNGPVTPSSNGALAAIDFF